MKKVNQRTELKKARLSPKRFDTTINNPQNSIKPDKFLDRVSSYSLMPIAQNGFYVSEPSLDDPDYQNLDEQTAEFPDDIYGENIYNNDKMGFSIFGVDINTDALIAKAESLAQTQVTSYLTPNATTIPLSAITVKPVTSPINPTLKIALMAGGGLAGLFLLIKALKK